MKPLEKNQRLPGGIQHWREELNIHVGMSKEQAFENFRVWRGTKKTCERCEGDKYRDYCDLKNFCEEADNDERNTTGDDNRGRVTKAPEPKTFRTHVFTQRQRASIREDEHKEESVS